jgi:acyl-coenzyme A thioesterase PaaI-like protein
MESREDRTGSGLPTTPPDDAVLPERSPHAPPPGSEIPSHYRWCFGCGIDHPAGLHMRLRAGAGLTVVGTFTVTENHQGAPGLAHGGVLAAAFDEVLGASNWLLARPAVTARLETDFRRPVPVGAELHMTAEITGVRGRKVWTRAVGRLGGEDGPVAVTAAALFLQVRLEHFRDHGAPEHVEQAIEDRATGGPAWRFEVNP